MQALQRAASIIRSGAVRRFDRLTCWVSRTTVSRPVRKRRPNI